MLNPLNWDPANLERLATRRPAEGGGLIVAAGVTSALPPYLRPDRLDEALAILASEPRLVVAGGTDVYPAYATRPIDRPVLDITALPGLRGVADEGDRGGSRRSTTWTDLAETPLPPELDGLRAAARTIGGRQIQNAGTVCGNVVNASPAADGLPNLLALDARRRGRIRRWHARRADRGLRGRQPADRPAGRRARHGPAGAEGRRRVAEARSTGVARRRS